MQEFIFFFLKTITKLKNQNKIKMEVNNQITKLIFFIVTVSVVSQDFAYDGDRGPSHWGEQYNSCFGKHQSPINIDSVDVKHVVLPPLKLSGFDELPIKTTITNNGHTGKLKLNKTSYFLLILFAYLFLKKIKYFN